MTATLQDLADKLTEMKATMKTEGKRLFGEYLKVEIAKLPPDVTAVRWTQYAPHFNDGDPCVFGVNERRFKLAASAEDDGDDEDGFVDTYSLKGKPGIAAIKAFDKAMGGIDEALFEAAFGDDAEVTATRTESGGIEITVDEYEHD